jgi:hypothetical protein
MDVDFKSALWSTKAFLCKSYQSATLEQISKRVQELLTSTALKCPQLLGLLVAPVCLCRLKIAQIDNDVTEVKSLYQQE